jgi:hypothetical protein
MNPIRLILTFILLCPYFVFYRMEHHATPFWQDMIFAVIAFGIGHLVFPERSKMPRQPKKENKNIIDKE